MLCWTLFYPIRRPFYNDLITVFLRFLCNWGVKTKEEYEKWKAERAKSNAERLQKEKDEERLRNLWICPQCLFSNDKTQAKCNCGYAVEKENISLFRGNISPSELYSKAIDYADHQNAEMVVALSKYLIKRFPETEESKKISFVLNRYAREFVCGNCGATNQIHKLTKTEICSKCGAILFETEKKRVKLINCPACKNVISVNAPSCPKCAEPLTEENKNKALEKAIFDGVEQDSKEKVEIKTNESKEPKASIFAPVALLLGVISILSPVIIAWLTAIVGLIFGVIAGARKESKIYIVANLVCIISLLFTLKTCAEVGDKLRSLSP